MTGRWQGNGGCALTYARTRGPGILGIAFNTFSYHLSFVELFGGVQDLVVRSQGDHTFFFQGGASDHVGYATFSPTRVFVHRKIQVAIVNEAGNFAIAFWAWMFQKNKKKGTVLVVKESCRDLDCHRSKAVEVRRLVPNGLICSPPFLWHYVPLNVK